MTKQCDQVHDTHDVTPSGFTYITYLRIVTLVLCSWSHMIVWPFVTISSRIIMLNDYFIRAYIHWMAILIEWKVSWSFSLFTSISSKVLHKYHTSTIFNLVHAWLSIQTEIRINCFIHTRRDFYCKYECDSLSPIGQVNTAADVPDDKNRKVLV